MANGSIQQRLSDTCEIIQMDLEAHPTDLGTINGFLEAFGWVNGKCNYDYTFTMSRIPKTGTLHAVLTKYFRDLGGTFEITAVESWRPILGEAVERWLFSFIEEDRSHYRVDDKHKNFCFSHAEYRKDLVETVLSRIEQVARPFAVWRVKIRPVAFYECDWDDFVFEAEEAVFVLHLGVSD